MKLKVFESFAGIGSQRKALQNIGADFEIVGISEIDKPALASYAALYGETHNYGDIAQIATADLPAMDIFTASFPCQAISVSGNRAGMAKGSGTTSSLIWECLRVAEDCRPKVILLENVKALLNDKNMPFFEEWNHALEDLGYTCYYQLCHAEDFGVAQRRHRVIGVYIHGDHKPFNFANFEQRPTKAFREIMLDADPNGKDYTLSPLRIERYRSTHNTVSNAGSLKVGMVSKDPNTRLGQRDRVYSPDYLLPTIMASDYRGPVIVRLNDSDDPTEVKLRYVFPSEYWMAQGFELADYNKARQVVSNVQLYKQAGNSIPVPLLEETFKEIIRCLS